MLTRRMVLTIVVTLIIVVAIPFFKPTSSAEIKKFSEEMVKPDSDISVSVTVERDPLGVAKQEVELTPDVKPILKEEETEELKVQLEEKTEDLKEKMSQASIAIREARLRKLEVRVASRGSSGYYDYNLLEPTNLTGEQLDKLVAGTGLAGLGEAYARAEKETGVNALFIMAISIHESAWGTSNFAKTRNNLFGYQAYTSNPNAAKHFNSKEECIMEVAWALKKNYLTEGGPYYNGVTVSAVNKRYASDPSWHIKVSSTMRDLSRKLK